MDDFITVTCPYCGEDVEMELDPMTTGSFVYDCEVCCRPWQVRVTRDADNNASVVVDRGQD
jgi:uncharacterized Zn finger protein